MLRSRGISERVVYAYNPLPAIDELELLKDAKLDELIKPSKLSPFLFTWKYSSGLTLESVELLPGDFLPLRESEAREFENSTNSRELGLCVVNHADADHAETRKVALGALAKAAQYYHENGRARLLTLRKRHNYSEADMEDMRHQFHAYYLNAAKERAIRALMTKLRAAPLKSTKAA